MMNSATSCEDHGSGEDLDKPPPIHDSEMEEEFKPHSNVSEPINDPHYSDHHEYANEMQDKFEIDITKEPSQFDIESVILNGDSNNDDDNISPNVENGDQEPTIPKITFITSQDVASKDSIFSAKLAPEEHRLKRQRTLLITAQNSHPNCFQPVTASKIHGGLLAKRKLRPRKSYKPMVVRNDINFPPIRASHTAPETQQRNSTQIVTRRMTMFARNSGSTLDGKPDFELRTLKGRRPVYTEPEQLTHKCSRYGRPYFNRQIDSVKTETRYGDLNHGPTTPSVSVNNPAVSNPSNSQIKWSIGNNNSLEDFEESLKLPTTRRRNRLTINSKTNKSLGLPTINGGFSSSRGSLSTPNLSIGDLHIAHAKNKTRDVSSDSNMSSSLPLI